MSHYLDTAKPRDPMTSRGEKSKLLTAAEAAERLRTTPINVVIQCRTGALRATKPFGRWLITEEAIDELLQAKSNAHEVANGGAA